MPMPAFSETSALSALGPELLPESLRGEAQARQGVRRVLSDYHEMPGLRLTLEQGCRLWALSPEVCRPILDALIAKGLLKRVGTQYSLR